MISRKHYSIILLYILIVSSGYSFKPKPNNKTVNVIQKEYLDSSRMRSIPVAIYIPKNSNNRLIFFSHGYRGNTGDGYMDYSYLLKHLAQKGYTAVSIQHELKTDVPLCMDGIIMNTRMPDWEKGSRNILYVLEKLKEEIKNIDYNKVILIGHSNGGDMTMLFATKYPEFIYKAISLDNRRHPLPRTANPQIYSIRSNDYEADNGVLPTPEEQNKWGITIDFSNINHNNMNDNASKKERKEILRLMDRYLMD